MNRQRLIAIIGATLLIGALALHFIIPPAEPTHKGRTITSYLEGPWKQIEGPDKENPHFAPDIEAIRAIGTNGIPTLLKLIQAKDPIWKKKLFTLLRRQSIVRLEIHDAESRRELGFFGFASLGSMANSAMPELRRLAVHRDPEIRAKALRCLSEIDPLDSFPDAPSRASSGK